MMYLKGGPVWRTGKGVNEALTNQDKNPEQCLLQLLHEYMEHYQQ